MMPETSDPAAALFEEGMAGKHCVSAVYNGRALILAPHQLFERHGHLYVRAVTVEVDGEAPREAKIGTYKLSGLREAAGTRKPFRPQLGLLAAVEPHIADTVVTAIS